MLTPFPVVSAFATSSGIPWQSSIEFATSSPRKKTELADQPLVELEVLQPMPDKLPALLGEDPG
jgi:hypothetical protein